ncbi:hypothetical protein RB628_39995 [Streptomyces sp. ADMS]|uniref:hypothetical protein n=1 Tax=Streptomyces sp. ADMS TaxID=3071415 RepID=UPI00296FAB19|nr:hypothetical protein [Streptomyces sp. ADMS]MDW4911312.1 hypothetical protein [Streptomyces sp. ADMS]
MALADHWDIAGAGCESGILGAGAGNPAFVMMPLNADVAVKGGYYQDGIGASALRHPGRVPELHDHARRVAFEFDWLEGEQRRWAERRLGYVTAENAR